MDIEKKIEEVCEMQKCIITAVKNELNCGIANVDTNEAGQAIDMIKDLAETEKNLRESKYYETVTKAMGEVPEEAARYGYIPRMDIDERYGYTTPRVRGTIRYGYKPMVDQEPYVEDYISNPDRFRSRMGEEYDKYKTAKKWYTDTKSTAYKDEMGVHTKKHLDNTVEAVKEMWMDATPELRTQIKADLTKLIGSLTV